MQAIATRERAIAEREASVALREEAVRRAEARLNAGVLTQGIAKRVSHVSIVVRDAAVSAKFYERVFAVPHLNRPAFDMRGAWLWLGNLQLHIIETTTEAAAYESAHAPDHKVGIVNHIAFEVDDFARTEKQLSTMGVNFKKNIVNVPEDWHGPGLVMQQLFFCDPDGHYVEVCDCQKLDEFVFSRPQRTQNNLAPCGSYHQRGWGAGVASYHFPPRGRPFISYAHAPSEWNISAHLNEDERKVFQDTTFDAKSRTFTGRITWSPAYMGTAVWTYKMVFTSDYTGIESGAVEMMDNNSHTLRKEEFGVRLFYQKSRN